MQEKAWFYFNMGISLGRILEISNINNTIFALLTLCEEIEKFDIWYAQAFSLPCSSETLTQSTDHQYELKDYFESIKIGMPDQVEASSQNLPFEEHHWGNYDDFLRYSPQEWPSFK